MTQRWVRRLVEVSSSLHQAYHRIRLRAGREALGDVAPGGGVALSIDRQHRQDEGEKPASSTFLPIPGHFLVPSLIPRRVEPRTPRDVCIFLDNEGQL